MFYCFMENRQINDGQYRLKKYIPKFLGEKKVVTINATANPEDDSKMGQWINHISQRNRNDNTDMKTFIKL